MMYGNAFPTALPIAPKQFLGAFFSAGDAIPLALRLKSLPFNPNWPMWPGWLSSIPQLILRYIWIISPDGMTCKNDLHRYNLSMDS